MKILVVSQYYYPEPFRIHEICEELVKRGHNINVVTANPNYPDGEIYVGYKNKNSFEVINGVNIYRVKCRPRHKGIVNLVINYIDFLVKATRFINKLNTKFECVFAYQLSPITSCIPAIIYKNKKSVPMLLYSLDVWPESVCGSGLVKGPLFKLIEKLSKWIYSQADLLAVSSPSFSPYLASLCGKVTKRIITIPQHAREIVLPNQINKELLRYREFINFVFIGNVGESQNVEGIIKAISYIKEREKIKLHIIGSGSYLDICKEVSRNLKTDDTVIFHGRRHPNEMPLYYSIADVCIVSLRGGGIVGCTIPGKLQEYMSAGKTILGFINGDAEAIIKQANCGYCVSASDDKMLAEKMQQIIDDKNCLHQFGENAKIFYHNNFTLEAYVNKLEKELLELVEVS